ncbi:MAG: hypothetical protein IPG75_10005 [Gemmatimonadetes bacterium]|nr:hypothetical protein [Gemmatimonadota bacterium]
MGRWNAEIMRLSGLERFFAKTFLGGAKIFSAASWDSAVVCMDRAVAASPETIYHHLGAEISWPRRGATPRPGHLEEEGACPVFDVVDPRTRTRARRHGRPRP